MLIYIYIYTHTSIKEIIITKIVLYNCRGFKKLIFLNDNNISIYYPMIKKKILLMYAPRHLLLNYF